jgi:hypothetical protein
VLLHRVGHDAQGPVDSTRSDPRGRFRFAFQADTGAFYLLSSQYAGIEYFSEPVPTNPARPDTTARIQVYDTSSRTPVSIEARHLVITRPGQDGSRSVLDLIVLRNDGHLTRIAPDTAHPTWSGSLPRGSIGLDLAESDFSPDAVVRRGDAVSVLAPFAPGQKQVTVQYLIPSGRSIVELPLAAAGAAINVLAEETGVKVSGSGITLADSQVIQGRAFHRWTGVAQPGALVRIALPGTGRTPLWMLVALVGALTVTLGVAGWRLLSRPAIAPSRTPEELIEGLAALDVRYSGRQEETSAEEWSAYVERRQRMRAELEQALAARRAGR